MGNISHCMKGIKLICSAAFYITTFSAILGCSHAQTTNESLVEKPQEPTQVIDKTSSKVMQALALAKQNKDLENKLRPQAEQLPKVLAELDKKKD